MITVKMYPMVDEVMRTPHTGMAQVISHWAKYLPDYGIKVVGPGEKAQVVVGHSASELDVDIHVSHGLLWTGDFPEMGDYSYTINRNLVYAALHARRVIVPSEWVANVYRRDTRLLPDVIRHGVDWDEWQHTKQHEGYVLWAKNRTTDGLNPYTLYEIASALPNIQFKTTYGDYNLPNVEVFGGALPFDEMKDVVQRAGVLIMTDRETWGIAAAEALSAGTPVVTVKSGAVPDFVEHGVTGYAYFPNHLDDAIQGIEYCLQYRDTLSKNATIYAKEHLTWPGAVRQVASVIKQVAAEIEAENHSYEIDKPPDVDVVITSHNFGHVVGRAIESVLHQTYPVHKIIVVDDSSEDETMRVVTEYQGKDERIEYIRVDVQNVAIARNTGIYDSSAPFIVSLDGDDWLEPGYIVHLIPALLSDRSVGFAYTGVTVIDDQGVKRIPPELEPLDGEVAGRNWPTDLFDLQFQGTNQIITTSLFRRDALLRIGGYRSRYSPGGAGSEDAELYLRLLAHGFRGKLLPAKRGAMLVHTHGKGHVSGTRGYREPDWTAWHPWTKDFQFPFAAAATPKNHSHPVYSYEPEVSVIIPVGKDHVETLVDALDSLEAQYNRNWEAVVIWDCNVDEFAKSYYETAYPYVTWGRSDGSGPGRARNIGVELAKADYITFLDADDYYDPEFLSYVTPEAVVEHNAIIYSQYFSRMSKKQHKKLGGSIIEDEGRTVVVSYGFRPYTQERAVLRPSGNRPYVWTGVNILLPKTWFESVGGFDETMRSWEDCLLMLELAWSGYDFHMIEHPLWYYSFLDGARREDSSGNEHELMKCLQKKWDYFFAEVNYAV